MSKFDEAIDDLKKVIWDDKRSARHINLSTINKLNKALELGKLYQKYYKGYDTLTLNELISILERIKELENE